MDQLTPDEADLDATWEALHTCAAPAPDPSAAAAMSSVLTKEPCRSAGLARGSGTGDGDVNDGDYGTSGSHGNSASNVCDGGGGGSGGIIERNSSAGLTLFEQASLVPCLDYRQACQAAAKCPTALGPHLSAMAWLRLRRGPSGAVPVSHVYDYMARRAAMLQLRQHLQRYGVDGRGALTTSQMEGFVASLCGHLPSLAPVGRGAPGGISVELYATVAARKLLFFHGRSGWVRIKDLMASPNLAELLQLPPPCADPEPQLHLVPDAPATDREGNTEESWFAPQTAVRLKALFQSLDSRGCARLGQQDLLQFSGAGFTPLFVARVLEEHGRGTSSPAAAAQQVTIRWYHHVTPGTSWKSSVRNPKQNIEESCVGRRRIHATLTVLYSQTLLCVPARCRLIWVPCLFVGRSGTNCLYKYLFQKQNKKQ